MIFPDSDNNRMPRCDRCVWLGGGAMYAAYFAVSIITGYVDVHGESLLFCTQPLGGSIACGSWSNGTI